MLDLEGGGLINRMRLEITRKLPSKRHKHLGKIQRETMLYHLKVLLEGDITSTLKVQVSAAGEG